MAFQVSCPTCESRMKLPDRLYEDRVRGRLATIRCTRCKGELQIDGLTAPTDKKLTSVRPPAPLASGAPVDASDESRREASTNYFAEAARADGRLPSSPQRLLDSQLRNPSPEDLKALFEPEEGWESGETSKPASTRSPAAARQAAPSGAAALHPEPLTPATEPRTELQNGAPARVQHTDFSALLTPTSAVLESRESRSAAPAPAGRRRRVALIAAALCSVAVASVLLAQPKETEKARLENGAALAVQLSASRSAAALRANEEQAEVRPSEVPAGKQEERARTSNADAAAASPVPALERPAPRARKSSANAFGSPGMNRELDTAASRARRCARYQPEQKRASVSITFRPTGRVRAVRVAPPLAGTRLGTCLTATFRSLRVPAFEGSEVTVSRTVALKR
jgi:hypothetical protein